MARERVLFVCVHNSARSQMAEAFLNRNGGERFLAESAGLEPGVLNPLAVEVMKEEGIDISGNRTKGVDEFLKQGREFSWVITVCDETAAERCPLFPGGGKRLHWSLPDPSALKGTREEKLRGTREVREQIKEKVLAFIRPERDASMQGG